MHKSLPPLAPPVRQVQTQKFTLPTALSGEFLLLGAAFLILIFG